MKLVIGGYAQGKLEYVLREAERETGDSVTAACGGVSGSCPDKTGDGGDGAENIRSASEVCRVWDGVLPGEEEAGGKRIVLNHFHLWVKERIRQGGCPEEEAPAFAEAHPDCVIICDEIGNGIVPIDGFEREYRERTGRTLVKLAEKAEEVIRVICGMGQKIK